MSSLRDQGGSAQLCSEGIQITNAHTALLMYWRFNREVGNACGDNRGACGKVGEDRMGVRATLPPSTLFADRVLLHRGYSISEPNT